MNKLISLINDNASYIKILTSFNNTEEYTQIIRFVICVNISENDEENQKKLLDISNAFIPCYNIMTSHIINDNINEIWYVYIEEQYHDQNKCTFSFSIFRLVH